MKTTDNPGVYIAPPMIYAAIFGIASVSGKLYPIDIQIFKSRELHILGWILIIITLGILVSGVWRFWRSKNTLITIKPATSLQTTGIFAYTRNPMYLALLILYCGLACFSGNCWTFIFLPLLFLIIRNYVILREERYLERAFSAEYILYKKRVRRWI
jgi:protein-S-isoprenylcysteine O-methyltransferase Ste14